MDQIDIGIIKFVNSFAWQSSTVDRIIIDILQMDTFKALPIVCAMIWLWFSESSTETRRKAVFNGLLGGLLALLLTRGIQNFSFYRPRPSMNASLDFVLPAGAYFNYGSSFPSDTAGLAFALALGIWFASRRLGLAAFVWSIAVVSFPRLYGGYHYPSDLFAGALIGLASTFVFMRWHAISDPLYGALVRLSVNNRPWFFVFSFIIAYQSANYYLDIRKVGEQALFKLGFKQEKLKELEKQEKLKQLEQLERQEAENSKPRL
jgi:membrane-associated phospholipid phosphatase